MLSDLPVSLQEGNAKNDPCDNHGNRSDMAHEGKPWRDQIVSTFREFPKRESVARIFPPVFAARSLLFTYASPTREGLFSES
jgi:hypothetical protein